MISWFLNVGRDVVRRRVLDEGDGFGREVAAL
jgi:hypothetical protein